MHPQGVDSAARAILLELEMQERDLYLFRDDALLDIVGEAVGEIEERVMEKIREEKLRRNPPNGCAYRDQVHD